jgi:hypothetical protein
MDDGKPKKNPAAVALASQCRRFPSTVKNLCALCVLSRQFPGRQKSVFISVHPWLNSFVQFVKIREIRV